MTILLVLVLTLLAVLGHTTLVLEHTIVVTVLVHTELLVAVLLLVLVMVLLVLVLARLDVVG